MNRPQIGLMVHRALELVNENYPLEQVVGSMSGRYGRGDYEIVWRKVLGHTPHHADEQAIVNLLVKISQARGEL